MTVGVKLGVDVAVLVKVPVGTGVQVRVAVEVGVAVAWATVIVAPETGRPVNNAAWPLFPTAPVTLKVKIPAAFEAKLAVTV